MHTGLTAIKGYRGLQQKLNELATTAWIITHAFIYPHLQFTSQEKEKAIQEIKAMLISTEEMDQALGIYLQRIILSVLYKKTGEPVSWQLPSTWLCAEAGGGFGRTDNPMKQIQLMRKSVPEYRADIKALGEAIIEMREDPTNNNFHYWKNHLIQLRQERMLELFCIACTHLHYNHE